MSKRTGEMVTFEDLLDEVGPDAARYFFLRRSTDQALDFDIGLAKEQSSDNPVYYVQYAHARICSILRKAAGQPDADMDAGSLVGKLVSADVDLSLLAHDAELALFRKLAEFGEVVETAATQRAPHKLTRYAEELARRSTSSSRCVTSSVTIPGSRPPGSRLSTPLASCSNSHWLCSA